VASVAEPLHANLHETPFHCPWCAGRLSGTPQSPACEKGHEIEAIDGVPLLVRDASAIATAIAEASAAGREHWYQDDQSIQFTISPWRHHFRRRRAYVSNVLELHTAGRSGLVGLDLGCGDGEHLPWLAQYVSTLYASDYNLVRLVRAGASRAAVVVFADVTDYPADDNSFDVIFFNHVLEHIPDDVGALRELHRVLAPGGIVILGTPNEGAAFWQLAYRLQPESRRLTDHVHFYTERLLTQRCVDTGFEIKEMHPTGWGLPHWTLDGLTRQYKLVDDAFEAAGRRLLRSQATSLYAILSK
jgi:2-polyprenyl-3-methyl-5-hydroxy-6-metoxy-1,4-benzoquinol methylase